MDLRQVMAKNPVRHYIQFSKFPAAMDYDENDSMQQLTILNPSTSLTTFMKEIVENKEDDESFYVFDIQAIIQQYDCWVKHLPTIKPHYAMKCNDNRLLMEVLLTLGAGFDCASQEEIKRALEVGATPDDIIYAHPSKLISHLKYAKEHGVSLMTFDSACELYKVKKHYPEARLVLRIKAEAEKCLGHLGDKFGCEPNKAIELMKCAKSLNLNVIGISFHVGTGCFEEQAYPRAIHIAADLILLARRSGILIRYLDIGGGFPGDSQEMFEKMARGINEALESETILKDVEVIAEPGRYLVCKAFTLATAVTSTRESQSYNVYYINNGIYGSFNNVYTEHAIVNPIPLYDKDKIQKKCTVWGQTEEKDDKVINECLLPKMNVGDWIYFENMGAYSTVLSVKFYGFSVPEVYPIIRKQEWIRLQMMISSKKGKTKKSLKYIK